jgi:predicted RNA-binding protein
MYGPVPVECEQQQPVLEYDYVLAKEDGDQIELVTKRVRDYLEEYGSEYDLVLGYVTNKTYRQVIEDAFEAYGRGTVLPRNPRALQLTEFFRNNNIDQLIQTLDEEVM